MKVFKDSFLQMAAEGRLSLQVPEYCIGTPDTVVTLPDDYFMRVAVWKSPDREVIAAGRKKPHSVLCLTEKGFNHFFYELEAAFNTHTDRGNTWEDFVVYAMQFFDGVHKWSDSYRTHVDLRAGTLRMIGKSSKYYDSVVDEMDNLIAQAFA